MRVGDDVVLGDLGLGDPKHEGGLYIVTGQNDNAWSAVD